MSVSPLFGNPKPQWQNSSSVNFNGATLSFYAENTSTPQDTFTDSTGTITNPNPITLNARGEPQTDAGVSTMIYGTDGQGYKVVLKDSDGATIWTMNNISTGENLKNELGSKDTDDGTKGFHLVYYPVDADENTLAITPTEYEYKWGTVERYGAVEGSDAATAINNGISYLNQVGGGDLIIDKQLIINSGITLKSNVRLILTAGASLTANASMVNMITLTTGGSNMHILGPGKIDANSNVTTYTVIGTRVTDCSVKETEIVGWEYGICFQCDATNISSDIRIEANKVHAPATANVVYPIWCNSTTGNSLMKRVFVNYNTVIGTGDAYSASNDSTADQISLHGVDDFECIGNRSIDGGEVGITVSRLSKNGIVKSNIVYGCDADGIDIGSGFVEVTVSDASNFAVSDTLTDTTTSAAGTIAAINGNVVSINSVSGGRYVVGDTVSDGTDTSTITAIDTTRNIRVSGNMCYNNGLDADVTGSAYTGIRCQQTDDISLSENNCYDTQSTQTQDYGLVASQSLGLHIDASNTFNNNLTGDVLLQGTYTLKSTKIRGIFALDKGPNLTIDNGAVTATYSFHKVDTEGAAGTDDLTAINGGEEGMILHLMPAASTRDVVVKDGTGIRTNGDFTMDHTDDVIDLIYDDATSSFKEVSRSDNAT